MIDKTKIEEIKDAIVARLSPQEVFLFGSYARGDAHENSDLDFLIIVDDNTKLYREMYSQLYFSVQKPRPSMDFVFERKSDFEFWKSSINHLSARAAREGIKLYERKN